MSATLKCPLPCPIDALSGGSPQDRHAQCLCIGAVTDRVVQIVPQESQGHTRHQRDEQAEGQIEFALETAAHLAHARAVDQHRPGLDPNQLREIVRTTILDGRSHGLGNDLGLVRVAPGDTHRHDAVLSAGKDDARRHRKAHVLADAGGKVSALDTSLRSSARYSEASQASERPSPEAALTGSSPSMPMAKRMVAWYTGAGSW